MKQGKIILLVLIVLGSIYTGCINKPSSYVGYSIYVTPDEGSESTLIIPVVIDKKSGEIDGVMNVDPRFPEGSALLEIIKTDKGLALKIKTYEETVIRYTKDYKENGAELMVNKTLSMTNITYDEKEKKTMKSWIYVNSTTNKTTSFVISFHAGDSDRVRVLRLSGVNVSNGWHQITVEEGYMVS